MYCNLFDCGRQIAPPRLLLLHIIIIITADNIDVFWNREKSKLPTEK